jgi:hypothetical protein
MANTAAAVEAHAEIGPSQYSAIRNAAQFVRTNWLRVALISVVVLIPCFWQHHIQAADLGSHVYNAWLAQLIQRGEAPGLVIIPQTSNVLFDLLLSSLFSLGPWAAEHIAVTLAVLVLFWGSFALCSAAAGRSAWIVTPLLVMACYGFVFNMGFFNLYLSAGLSLFGLAILWRGARWDFLTLIPLGALIWMSHMMGTAGLLCLGALLVLLRVLPLTYQLIVAACSLIGYFAARWYVLGHFPILPKAENVYWMAGADQFVLDSGRSRYLAMIALTVMVLTVVLGLLRGGRDVLKSSSTWLQIYLVVAIAVMFAPGGIWTPKLGLMGYLPDRASLYTAALLCSVVAAVRPPRWMAIPFAAIALAYFALLYMSTLPLDQLEQKIEAAVSSLSPESRVAATFWPPVFPIPGSRVFEQHVVERTCIGHCFFIANYEPASNQFRIRVTGENRLAASTLQEVMKLNRGEYLVRPEDLPLTEIYACGPGLNEICLHQSQSGEYNGQVAYDEMVARQGRGTQ